MNDFQTQQPHQGHHIERTADGEFEVRAYHESDRVIARCLRYADAETIMCLFDRFSGWRPNNVGPDPECEQFEVAGAGILQFNFDVFARCGKSAGIPVDCGWSKFGMSGGVMDVRDLIRLKNHIVGYLSNHDVPQIEPNVEKFSDLLAMAYNAIHRQGWENGLSDSETSARINDFMSAFEGNDRWQKRCMDLIEPNTEPGEIICSCENPDSEFVMGDSLSLSWLQCRTCRHPMESRTGSNQAHPQWSEHWKKHTGQETKIDENSEPNDDENQPCQSD